MANNIVYFDTTNNSIQQFSANDVAKICDYILEYMAANGTFTGSITVGTSNPTIGTFTDTTLGGYPYPAANSTDVSIVSTIYTLSQVSAATLSATSDPPMYVGLDTTSVANTVILQENKTTLNNLADEIIDRMIGSYGVNSYYLGPSAPSDGGVWTSLGALIDTVDPSNTNNTYYLWKKINSGSYTTNFKRPLKLSSGELLQFSNTEIQQIVKTIEQRIVATGKGLYSLGAVAPATGTWTSVGIGVDVRRTTQEVTFTGSTFDGTVFTSDFDGNTFTGGNFAGPTFFGVTPQSFFSVSNYIFNSSFTGTFTGVVSTPYIGPATYTGDNVTPFDGSGFTGQVATDFINPDRNSYTNENKTPFVGTAVYQGFLPTWPYVGPTATYIGPNAYVPSNFFSPATYLGPVTYLGPSIPYTGTAPGPTYIGTYFGPANFTGTDTYIGDVSTNYVGPSYVSSFAGPIFYGPSYVGTVPASFTGLYTGDYTASYTADYTASYTGDYTGTRVSSSTTTVSTRYLWKRIA